jgi:hypothetical protein
MNTGRLLLNLLVSSTLMACITAPQKAIKQTYAHQCKDMLTRKIELSNASDITSALRLCATNSNLPACLLSTGVISSVSVVVSGSIMLVGNTIHWMEYAATC